MKLNLRRWWPIAMLGLRIFVVSLVVLLVKHQVAIDGRIYDLIWHGRRTTRSDIQPVRPITIVELDNATLTGSAARNPYPRDKLTAILAALRPQHPRVIVLDVFLTDDFEPARDGPLAAEIRRCGNVILAMQPPSESGPEELPIYPAPEFAKAAKAVGVAAFEASEDGVVRDFRASFPSSDGPRPSVTEIALGQAGSPEVGPAQTIDFGIRRGRAIHYLSGYDVLNASDAGLDLSKEEIRDNIVIVGPFDSYSADQFQSPDPSWNRGSIRGSELLAMAMQTGLSAHQPITLADPPTYTIAFCVYVMAWIALATFITRGEQSRGRLLALFLAAAGIIGLGFAVGRGVAIGTLAVSLLAAQGIAKLAFRRKRGDDAATRRPLLRHLWCWLIVAWLLAFDFLLGVFGGVLMPISLIAAAWILGWEAGELFHLEVAEIAPKLDPGLEKS